MFPKPSRALTICGLLAVAGSGNLAWSQVPFNACCPPPVQTCYQTVPTTEMRECRQTVQRPVVETTYVDQPCTEYRQVVENQTAVVPTVSYQNVTECQTVQRDMGRWVTRYHCRPQMAPCEYDNRPDLLGELNRSAYALRMAFTPKTYAERVYVPNVVTETVPTVRQVAVHGTRTVNYQVARMVPYTTTRRVAVNTVRMVAQEVVTRHPVTVYRTVPVGSSLALGPVGGTAWAPTPAAPRSAALQPTPEPLTRIERRAAVPAPIDPFSNSTATRPMQEAIKVAPKAPKPLPDALSDDADDMLDSKPGLPIKKSSLSRPADEVPVPLDNLSTTEERVEAGGEPQVAAAPTALRVGRWVARRTPRPTAPELPEPSTIAVAGAAKSRR